MQDITDSIEEARLWHYGAGTACTLSEDCLLIHCSNSFLRNLTLVPCSSPPVLMINVVVSYCTLGTLGDDGGCTITLNPTFNNTAMGSREFQGMSSPTFGFNASLYELEGAVGLKVSVA